jgi:hypothetical protein
VALSSLLKTIGVKKITDEQLIRAVYAERGRTDSKGHLYYFESSSAKVQVEVASRFRSELKDALNELQAETAA